MSSDEPRTERGWWDFLLTQTPESAAVKARMDGYYAGAGKLIRDNRSLKNIVGWWGQESHTKPIPKGYFDALNEVHPQALLLLAEYGTEYKPFLWNNLPFEEPKPRSCFGNSARHQYLYNRVMRKESKESRLAYVEGVSLGSHSVPVLHAWNALVGTDMAIDWTWYAVTGWMFYLGIPLTRRQHMRLRKMAYPKGGFHLLLKKDVFPRIEEPLTKILKRGKGLQKK